MPNTAVATDTSATLLLELNTATLSGTGELYRGFITWGGDFDRWSGEMSLDQLTTVLSKLVGARAGNWMITKIVALTGPDTASITIVRDNGFGIRHDILTVVFDKSVRLDVDRQLTELTGS